MSHARLHARRGRRAAAVVALFFPLAVACSGKDAPPAPGHGGRQIILVGLDAADWAVADPMLKAGLLPAFARLRASGRTGVMAATPPLLSPILWTTIATGRPPDEHGVLDFMMDRPGGGQEPVSVASRRVPALWNLFSDAGRRVGVVGWWATWPAEAVNGTIVSDRVAPQLGGGGLGLAEGSVAPASVTARLASAFIQPGQLGFEDLRAYVPLSRGEFDAARSARERSDPALYKDRIAHLASVVAGTRSYSGIARSLLAEGPLDLLAVYIESIDTVSHLFVSDPRRGPSAIAAAYRDADALLVRLAEASPPDAWFVVCSDHGFYPADAGVAEDPSDLAGPASAWHRPYGIVAAIEAAALAGRATPTGGALGPVTPLDIAPTVLHAAGLPVGDRMPGRVVRELLPPEAVARPVARASFPDVAPRLTPASAQNVDADLTARLRALGYVGGSGTSLARRNLGEILYRRGKLVAAEHELRAAADAQPRDLGALLWLAKVLRDQRRAQEALRVYAQAAALGEGPGDELVEGAEVAVAAGLLDEGRGLLRGAPRPAALANAHVARAILAQGAHDEGGAESELRAALARDPLSFEALSRLLDLLVREHRVGPAIPVFRKAAELAPRSPRHVALLGECLLAAGAAPEAEQALARALGLAPDGTAVRLDLARAQMAQRKLDLAAATLAEASASRERSVLLGAICSLQERWADAAAHYASALEAGPSTTDVLNALGWSKLKLGQSQDAADLFRRSLALDRNQPEIGRLVAGLAAPEGGR